MNRTRKKSFWQELRDSVVVELLDFVTFLKQRRLVLREPKRIVSDPDKRLRVGSITFALQGMILGTGFPLLIGSAIDFASSEERSRWEIEYDEAKAEESENRARWLGGPDAPFASVYELVIQQPSAAAKRRQISAEFEGKYLSGPYVWVTRFVVTAMLFGFLIRLKYRTATYAHDAERAYVYLATALLFFPVLLFSLAREIVDGLYQLKIDIRWLDLYALGIFAVWSWIALWRAGVGVANILGIPKKRDERQKRPAIGLRLVASVLIANSVVAVPLVFAKHRYVDMKLADIQTSDTYVPSE